MPKAIVSIDGNEYTISSEKNFRVGFTNFYTRLFEDDGTFIEFTSNVLIVYSGNASIPYSIYNGSATEYHSTVSEKGSSYSAAPLAITGQRGHLEPSEISGFTDDCIFVGKTYDIGIADDVQEALLNGYLEAVNQMPMVCNAAAPTNVTVQPAIQTVQQGQPAAMLTCSANTSDGGTLSYTWYCDSTIVGTGNTYRPPTDEASVRSYLCIVTNTLVDPYYGTDSTMAISNLATVNVVQEAPGEDPGEPKKFPIKDWLKGYLLSLCSPRRAFPQREPIGYLYGHVAKEGETPTHIINGVDYVGAALPKVPEVDTREYPHLYVHTNWYGHRWFRACAEPCYWEASSGGKLVNTGIQKMYILEKGDAEWREIENPHLVLHNHSEDPYFKMTLLWSNEVVYKQDGSLLVSPSDPIPIYGEPVAYQYGTCPETLPDISSVYTPELQKEYPYAYVYREFWGYGYDLLICSDPLEWTTANNDEPCFGTKKGSKKNFKKN